MVRVNSATSVNIRPAQRSRRANPAERGQYLPDQRSTTERDLQQKASRGPKCEPSATEPAASSRPPKTAHERQTEYPPALTQAHSLQAHRPRTRVSHRGRAPRCRRRTLLLLPPLDQVSCQALRALGCCRLCRRRLLRTEPGPGEAKEEGRESMAAGSAGRACGSRFTRRLQCSMQAFIPVQAPSWLPSRQQKSACLPAHPPARLPSLQPSPCSSFLSLTCLATDTGRRPPGQPRHPRPLPPPPRRGAEPGKHSSLC